MNLFSNFEIGNRSSNTTKNYVQFLSLSILSLSIRGDHMKNVTDSFVSLGHWPSAGSFGFNTDILATNPINLSVVIGVLIFFGKGVCASCLFQE